MSVTTYQSYSNKRKQEETMVKLEQKLMAELERKQTDTMTDFISDEKKLVNEQAGTIKKKREGHVS